MWKMPLAITATLFLTAVNGFTATSTARMSVQPRGQAAAVDTTPPEIVITSPEVKRGVKLTGRESSVTVTGRATDASGVAGVTVNGQAAALDENGNFSAEVLLRVGDNTITIVATDVNRNRATERFIMARQAGTMSTAKKNLPPPIQTGANIALIIGNNEYQKLDRLKTAVNDAIAVDKVLRELYNFRTRLLRNATRKDILTALNELRKNAHENDHILIYYAGHGEFDRGSDKAYWLPVDAQPDDDTEWIIADNITASIKRLPSKHILIVSDSCYSGTLTRSAQIHLQSGERGEFLKKMAERSSRTLMASGDNEPVADDGGSGHSIFDESFIKALREMDKQVFTADEMFYDHIKPRVGGKSAQLPQYNALRNSGEEGGDFMFMKIR